MNSNRYRLVFNKMRGMLVAVAECAASRGKSAGGQSGARAAPASPVLATLRAIAWSALLLLGVVHGAAAQIVADPAGRGPGVTTAPNGVPLVNINRPSGAGVSHNQYQQFSVDGRGAILNNGAAISQTQLGGHVPGNANLGTSGPARIILNEVTGGSPSRLNGFVEVAGQRADVVISNGNGISVNGGGFINANRATLTTGAPVFGGDGSLAAFRVTRGGIQVEGAGFNGSGLEQVDLVARSVTLNGKLWADSANVVSGANRVDYPGLGVQVIEGAGARPTVGIDVASLGGMYANRIRLVGTEGGVGVRNAGTLAAQAGDFSIDSAGRVVLGGATSATGALAIRGAQGIDNAGSTAAGGTMTLVSDASVDNTGTLIAGGDLALAGQTVHSTGTLAAGIDANGKASQSGSLRLKAASVATATGDNLAGQRVEIDAARIQLGGSRTQAGADIALTARSGGVGLAGARVYAAGRLEAEARGSIDTRGAQVAAATIDAKASGDIDNSGGTLEATGSLDVEAGGKLANANGRIINTGTGSTQVAAATIDNTGEAMLGGNGDASIRADRIANTAGGQLVSGGALAIAAGESFDNAGGKTYAGTGLALDAQDAAVSNDGGSLAAGTSAVLRAGSLSNAGGKVLADADIALETGRLTGPGTIHAGRDLALTLGGAYVNAAGNVLRAERDLTIKAHGAFTNQARLEAVRGLQLDAARIDNQAGAVIHAGTTTLTTLGALSNAGRIEGDTLTTSSATLANSGTMLADVLTSQAERIGNDGPHAVMAATGVLNLYGSALVSNTNGATVYSLGDINIAADGERDERGLLKHRAARVVNDSSTIEAGSSSGVVEIAAQELVNQRPAPVVESDTTTETKHERKREKYVHCATSNAYPQMGCTWAVWAGPYKTPVDGTFDAAQIVSHDTGKKRLVVNIDGVATRIDYNTLTDADGVLAVNYWDGYDRDIHYDPASEYATRNDARKNWQRVEIARDTTTTTTTERDANPDQRGANLISGGGMILANVGTLTNAYSQIASGGDMLIGDMEQSGDVASGQFGSTKVVNTGRTLFERTRHDIVSTYAWNKEIDKDVGPVVQPSIIETPKEVGSIGGTITAGNRLTIYGGGIRNEDVGKLDPQAGTGSTGLPGIDGGATGGTASLANTPLTLPSNGLFHYRSDPDATYLIESDPRFANYGNFLSSDYMLGLLGIDPSLTQKRLGDGFYEQKLIRDQITELSGRVYLAGHDNAEDQYTALMASGVQAAQQFNILPGMALTAAQMSALTTDIVWLVSETVTLPDGGKQSVMVPRVYLAQANAADLKPNGALIAAEDIELRESGSMRNSGVIDAGSRLSIGAAQDLHNRGGMLRSAGVAAITAGRDIVNESGQIRADQLGLVAGRDMRNETLFDQQGVTHAVGNAKASASLFGRQAGITSTGDLLVSAGRDVRLAGATLAAGGNGTVVAGGQLTLDALAGRTAQSVYESPRQNSADSEVRHAVSSLRSGGSLATSSGGDTTLRGAQVQAGADLTMIAGGDFVAQAVTDERTHDSVGRSRKHQREEHSRDQTTVGVSISAGGNATLAAVKAGDNGGGVKRTDGKGNVELIGATVTAGADGKGEGALTVVGDRNVTVAEARELHDSSLDVSSRSGSFVRRTSKNASTSSHADLGVGSTLSGDSVKIQAGNDLLVRQSQIAGTTGVTLRATEGNVLVTAGQNIREESQSQSRKTSGVSGFAGQGGIGVGVGSSRASSASHALAVTQSDARSMVGASNGNVVIVAGKDAAIIGSDLVAGRHAAEADPAAGNIDIQAKNVMVAEGVDRIAQDASASRRSSGLSVALVGTPFDTYKNLDAVHKDGSAVSRALGTVKELGASALTTPQIAVSAGSQRSSSEFSSVATVSSGSSLTGAGNVRVRAIGSGETDAAGKALDGNILASGSTISAGGAALLDAERGVTIQASTDTYSERSSARNSGWKISGASPSLGDVARHIGGGPNNSGVGMVPFGTERASSSGEVASSRQNASMVTGNTVGIKTRTGDITLTGSGLAAEGDIGLSAAQGRIDILSGQDTLSQRSDSASRKIGDLGGTGYAGTVGMRSESRHADGTQATQNTIRSQVVSQTGNVTMVAKDDITARGADIAACNDLTMIGRNVVLDPADDAASLNERHRVSQYGTTLALSGYTVTAAQAVENAARAVEEKKDGRVATLYGVQAGLAVANGVQGIQAVTSGGTSPTAAIKVTASVGGGSQSSESRSQSNTFQGTTVKAGNAVAIVATGSGGKDADGFASDGTISGRGVQISGRTVDLSAALDVDLESARDRTSLDSRSSGNNASVGVGFGIGGDQNGFTLELAASQQQGNARGNSVTNRNASVTAADKLTVTSGRDANLRGAQLIADTIGGSVGRDFNIESRPDTDDFTSRETSSGMQASICVPPFCVGTTVNASGTHTQGKTDSTYSSVREQSGIYAGQGGFDIPVKGNTDLRGGILASTADPEKNRLVTGTLTTSDIDNHASYTSGSSTFVGSYSGGKSVPADTPDVGPVAPAQVKWGGDSNLLQGVAGSLAATAAGNA